MTMAFLVEIKRLKISFWMDKSINLGYLLNSMTLGSKVLDGDSPCEPSVSHQPLWEFST